MKLIIFIIGMLCIQTMLYGQNWNKELFERKEQDSIAVDNIKQIHQKYVFGPIDYSIDMVEKVEEATDAPEVSRLQRNRVKVFKEKLRKLNTDINEAEERVKKIDSLQNLLNQKVNSGEIIFVKQYDEEREKLNLNGLIKDQTQIQPKIEKQQSKRSLKVAWFYRFYKKKDDENLDDKEHFQHVPLFLMYLNMDNTSDVRNSIDAQRKLAEFRDLKDSFNIQKNSVEILKTENEDKTNKLDSVKNELEKQRKNYDTTKYKMNTLKDSLKIARANFDIVKKEKEELKRLLLGDKEKLDSIKGVKETLDTKLAEEKETLQFIKRDKEALARESCEEAARFENKIQLLKQESEEIGNKNKELKEERDKLKDGIKKLEKWTDTINWLNAFLAISSLLLLIAFIGHHKKYKGEQKKSKLKLKRANLNLERTNKKLDRSNKKLTKNNIELNEKGDKLVKLMRELNHRTKNNLNEISSLLLLQKNSNSDETVKAVLEKMRSRVKTMGLIHKQLYRENSEELTTINLAAYVKELLSVILKDHPTYSDLKTNLMLDEIQMEMDLATKVGLVINELTQNSFNHAFKGVATPELSIEVTKTDNNLKIKVENNGNGLPDNFDLNNNSKFGLKLVSSLIGCGDFEYGSAENETFFALTFPVEVDEKGVVTKISY